jgi:hypothetical protein
MCEKTKKNALIHSKTKDKMAKKRRKKRVPSEPKPPTWKVYKSFNQTKEEVCFGISTNCKKWRPSKYEIRMPELAHWDLKDDKIMITGIYKRKLFYSERDALNECQYWERTYKHSRNFWVVQTGVNATRPPRERKPVKPLPPSRHYIAMYDALERAKNEENDDDLVDELEDTLEAEFENVFDEAMILLMINNGIAINKIAELADIEVAEVQKIAEKHKK